MDEQYLQMEAKEVIKELELALKSLMAAIDGKRLSAFSLPLSFSMPNEWNIASTALKDAEQFLTKYEDHA